MQTRKGILLTGGKGCRLYPVTLGLNKHLIPVWDRPLLYYPLATLIQAGVQEVLVVTTEHERRSFETLLGQGARWGMRFAYETQPEALGAGHALGLAADWLDGSPCVLAMGDNLFLGDGMPALLAAAAEQTDGATMIAARVESPQRYGIVKLDAQGRATDFEEKPARATSPWAVTGLGFYDGQAAQLARELAPSPRGQVELADLHRAYLEQGKLRTMRLGPTTSWWDCGDFTSLQDAASSLRTKERDTGLKYPTPEQAARDQGWLDPVAWRRLLDRLPEGPYRRYHELLPEVRTTGLRATA